MVKADARAIRKNGSFVRTVMELMPLPTALRCAMLVLF
jgi:hypothetical protein